MYDNSTATLTQSVKAHLHQKSKHSAKFRRVLARTLVAYSIYIKSESSPRSRRELVERNITCKILQELAQIVLAATISLSTAVDTCNFCWKRFCHVWESILAYIVYNARNCKSTRKPVQMVKRDEFGQIAKRTRLKSGHTSDLEIRSKFKDKT